MKKPKRKKSDLKARAFRLLAVRDRSVGELEERLKRDFGHDEVEEVIAYLKETGYLNDLRFAQNHVSSRNRFRPRGNFLLRVELKKKFISDAIIDEVLNSEEKEHELAHTLGKQRLQAMQRIEHTKRVRRLGSLLERRGFPGTVRRRVLSELLDSDL